MPNDTNQKRLTPATVYAARKGISRERCVRMIQRHELPGVYRDGKWLVDEGQADAQQAA